MLDTLGKTLVGIQDSADHNLNLLRNTITTLQASKTLLIQERAVLVRRTKRIEGQMKYLKQRLREKRRSSSLYLTHRGAYTQQARALARFMVSTGTAEAKVGHALQEIGNSLGIKIKQKMSKRTVKRAILEAGVAADVQLAYEMVQTDKIAYSSDSTSHKHIEYESRTIALKVANYTDPGNEPQWMLRTFGVGTSVNHTSETQVNGLKQRLEEIAEVFNTSPLATRKGLKFTPGDFAYRLIGTSGDHAADQKKSHEILKIWKMELTFQRLGEEALFNMDIGRVLARLIPLKAKQIEAHGGQEAWNNLSEDTRAAADIEIIREVGRQVFKTLPKDHQNKLQSFVRVGCCMHKDLNCFKGGDKSLQGMWGAEQATPPILLANKDNAAVLANRTPGTKSAPSSAELRAEQVSKRGGSHAAMLGGLICRNKDKKKGQQDTYNFYMEYHTGQRVPYPDVSNTRYGTHGEAAAMIIAYRAYFISFMEFVRDGKDKPGETNIEKNFARALKDIPTVTELCVLALYHINVSRPFMRHVRIHNNILDLRSFFEKKASFLGGIISEPETWTEESEDNLLGCKATLNRTEWDEWSMQAVRSIQKLAPDLPLLKKAIVAFVDGAQRTFVERFSEEFKPGGDIDKLTDSERAELFFSSTNDANEGGLGSWRLAQRLRPAETLHKFNASFISSKNDTEGFIKAVLTEPADMLHLRRTARYRDAKGIQKELKAEQIRADKQKVAANAERAARKHAKDVEERNRLEETSHNVVVEDMEIERLDNRELNRQLDYHRSEEKKSLMDVAASDHEPDGANSSGHGRVPLKSKMTNKAQRILELKKAVARYIQRSSANNAPLVAGSTVEDDVSMSGPEVDMMYESDHNDDLT
ncbi:hypothetical protein CPC08DRAFT_698685 [Agrocybe pediades]|nr:hypothetical protein CPC08DRAFT_698685 [Agrocybe pediades]